MKKINVGILGCTGMVGQKFIQLLSNHPYFTISSLYASEKNTGKTYREAVEGRWRQQTTIPENIKEMMVKECIPDIRNKDKSKKKDKERYNRDNNKEKCEKSNRDNNKERLVFGALDSSVAGKIEKQFADAGYIVSSNSKNYRMDKDTPLLIPEINSEHLESVEERIAQGKGAIITNPNCSTTGLCIALAPLLPFGLKKINVITMQALSGAGEKGFLLDIQDNVIPYINGEEEKMEIEPLKIFGSWKKGKGFAYAKIKISSSCNRVNVVDGHLECVSVKLKEKISRERLISALKKFDPLSNDLPSAPHPPIKVFEDDDRPQPKYDRNLGEGCNRGMIVSIGRIREDKLFDWKFIVLSHNTIRGAAGSAILNAEMLVKNGWLS